MRQQMLILKHKQMLCFYCAIIIFWPNENFYSQFGFSKWTNFWRYLTSEEKKLVYDTMEPVDHQARKGLLFLKKVSLTGIFQIKKRKSKKVQAPVSGIEQIFYIYTTWPMY